ncbi:MAG: polyamine ABC transporter substrate-binding protein [Rhizobium sp.]|nr:polyamine ABC transporter substrate-binding protein [Rhizobium sp.]
MQPITRRTALSFLGATALAAPFIGKARAEGGLNVYNWADYIGETTIEDFEKETGVSVVYDNYSSAEEMEAKMLAGMSGYDVVFTAGMGLPNLLKAGIYAPLDKTKLPGRTNLDPAILAIVDDWDPGNAHAIPYMWGNVGFTYNIDMVKERVPEANLHSLDTVFDPANAAKLADCGISILDSPTDIFFLVLKKMGRDPNIATEADFRAAAELFKPIRQHIRTFDNANMVNGLANKELCVANSWSGQFATAQSQAREAGVELNLGYFVPETGSPAWVDCMCIASDAANKDNAHKFLDFMLRPEVIAKCTNFTFYANANSKAKPLVDPAIAANPAIYPDQATMDRLYTPQAMTEEQNRILTRVWTDVKSG